jgi:K+-transporting ATPase ATPase C chain
MKTLLQSLRMLILLTVLTGILYPILITLLACACFHDKAMGSLIFNHNTVVGSSLLVQKCEQEDLFWPRPSGCDYGTVPSGASNLGPTSAALAKLLDDRRKQFGENAPVDLLTASGSGLDPHISPEAAMFQIARIAKSRKLPASRLEEMVRTHTENPQFGILGSARVNVFALNIALNQLQ